MDHNTPLEEIEKELSKLKVDLEVINLWGDCGAPVKRKDVVARIKELTNLKENYGRKSDQKQD